MPGGRLTMKLWLFLLVADCYLGAVDTFAGFETGAGGVVERRASSVDIGIGFLFDSGIAYFLAAIAGFEIARAKERNCTHEAEG